MKQLLIIIFLIAISTFGCGRKANPTNHFYKKDGVQWYTSKIYCLSDGKRKLAQKDTWEKENNSQESRGYRLQESILYYEQWPNREWKFVSKIGFAKYKNGISFVNNDSIVVPDNVIYTYYDKEYIEQIEVYKDGKRVKYTSGHPDGYRTMQFLRDKPGVYNWKDGKEYFEREFTPEEIERNNKDNEHLNKESKADTILIKDK